MREELRVPHDSCVQHRCATLGMPQRRDVAVFLLAVLHQRCCDLAYAALTVCWKDG